MYVYNTLGFKLSPWTTTPSAHHSLDLRVGKLDKKWMKEEIIALEATEEDSLSSPVHWKSGRPSAPLAHVWAATVCQWGIASADLSPHIRAATSSPLQMSSDVKLAL